MTPEELWKEAVKGSQKAWEELYTIFGTRLYQFFVKNTSNPELAMDKSQEVFEKVFRHKDDFQTGNLKTWIFRIAKNLLIDVWRRRGKAEILSEEPAPNVPDPAVRLEEEVIQRIEKNEMVDLIDDALPKLSEDDRILIGLTYLGRLTFPELAQVMEIPIGTAKTRVRQARLKLDQLLMRKIHGQAEKELQ